ncbi:MAG: M48 family metalloprotease [Gammaproteobacteria bacterium]|nr:M48 family metalloprotease [Gammaproteobacteria bacterium]
MRKFIKIVLLGLILWPLTITRAVEIALPEIGDSAGSLISPQQEYQIGLGFYWRLQQSVDLLDDPEINSYLQSLGYRLVANSDAPHLPFTFFMVPDTAVNAFAAPGGFIGVNSGLLLTSQREDEVASVLAHEIAHVTQRHLLRSFEKSQQMSIPMTIAMIAAALLGAADPAVGSAAIMAVQAGGVQSQLNFTRANESEADNLGMHTLVRSGFDALAMPAFFERLQQASRFYTGNAVPEFLRTHPVTTSRIADARGRAVRYPLVRQMGDTLQFYLMREKLKVMAATNLTQLTQEYENAVKTGNSLNKTATLYGYSLALSAVGNHAHARRILADLIKHDDDRLSYQLALAEIEIAVGRLSTALAIYQENQKLYPDDQALSLEQVSALLQANLPNEAAQLLLRQLELGAPSQQLYKLLAQAQGDMGKKSQSHSWLAEYYYISGRLHLAADQLRIAADFAKGDEYQLAKISSRLREVEITLAEMEES